MAIAKKVTKTNHLPSEGDGRFVVHSKQFNELVDVVNELQPSDGELKADFIYEKTPDHGVIVDGVTIKDGTIMSGGRSTAFVPISAQQNIAAGTGGAISLNSYCTTINTDAGGDAFTLADSTTFGHLKKIILLADGGGDATITLTGYTSIVMNDASDYVVLIWNGTQWRVIENINSTINA